MFPGLTYYTVNIRRTQCSKPDRHAKNARNGGLRVLCLRHIQSEMGRDHMSVEGDAGVPALEGKNITITRCI